MFLNGTSKKRPFGKGVILDGIDFDVKKHHKTQMPVGGAPQCVFPDKWFGPGSHTAISEADPDFISIQFYNSHCGIQSFFESGKKINFGQWSLAVTQANKNMKLFLGISASRSTNYGHKPADNIKIIYDTIKNATNFAGIMMWNAGTAKQNNNYGQRIRN